MCLFCFIAIEFTDAICTMNKLLNILFLILYKTKEKTFAFNLPILHFLKFLRMQNNYLRLKFN